ERVAEREGDWIRLTPLEPAPTLPVMLPSLAHPISRAIAIADPQAALAALAPLPHPFLLHSALEGEGARWSFFGADPFAIDRGERAEARLDDFTRRLESAEKTLAAGLRSGVHAVSTFTPDDYRRAVEKVKDHIRRGDIFQANLSQRWTVELPRGAVPGAMAWALEAALARRSQAPYAGFFDACDHAVACASPERFLTLRGRTVTTRPIKGTRPRGADPAQDRALRDALRASEKDRAENVMIVDVLRNDLGRVCEAG